MLHRVSFSLQQETLIDICGGKKKRKQSSELWVDEIQYVQMVP